jgi:hypothetical protein
MTRIAVRIRFAGDVNSTAGLDAAQITCVSERSKLMHQVVQCSSYAVCAMPRCNTAISA